MQLGLFSVRFCIEGLHEVFTFYTKTQVKNPITTSNGISHLPGWPDVSFLLRTSRGRKSGQKKKINGVFLPTVSYSFNVFALKQKNG